MHTRRRRRAKVCKKPLTRYMRCWKNVFPFFPAVLVFLSSYPITSTPLFSQLPLRQNEPLERVWRGEKSEEKKSKKKALRDFLKCETNIFWQMQNSRREGCCWKCQQMKVTHSTSLQLNGVWEWIKSFPYMLNIWRFVYQIS